MTSFSNHGDAAATISVIGTMVPRSGGADPVRIDRMIVGARLITVLAALGFLACALPARADPVTIRITGGFIEQRVEPAPIEEIQFNLSGQDFDLRASGGGLANVLCQPCPPGTLVSAEAFFSPHIGTLTYQGTSYEFDVFRGGDGRGEFSLSSNDQFTLPESAGDLVIFRSPFVVDPSSFMALAAEGLPVFTLALAGTGEATLTLRAESRGSTTDYFLESARYDFAPSDPVPEPATVLLLGTGIATLCVRRRRPR